MQTNEDHAVDVAPQDYSYVFNPYREPIATVKPGERVTIQTDDAFESRITKKEDLPSRALATAKFLNPQTGPIYVEGAEPGDTLAVRIENIEPTRDFAVSVLVPYFGGLTSTNFTRTLQEPLPERVWIWDLVDRGTNLLNEELDLKLPWEPFLGTLAVAPDLEAITALAPVPSGVIWTYLT
jgi:amidase